MSSISNHRLFLAGKNLSTFPKYLCTNWYEKVSPIIIASGDAAIFCSFDLLKHCLRGPSSSADGRDPDRCNSSSRHYHLCRILAEWDVPVAYDPVCWYFPIGMYDLVPYISLFTLSKQ